MGYPSHAMPHHCTGFCDVGCDSCGSVQVHRKGDQFEFRPSLNADWLIHAGQKKTPAMTRVMPGLHAIYYPLLLDVANPLGEQPFGPFLNGELDRLPLGEHAESFHLDFGLVAEQIFAAIVRGDEAKAFGFIEPLYFTLHSILCDFRNGPNALELWAPLITEL